MNKADVKYLLSFCTMCGDPFDPNFKDWRGDHVGLAMAWTFNNIDGEWVPVCWGCDEEIECGV